MLRLTVSDPLFAEWNELLTMRAQWINVGCFWDLQCVPSAERRAMVATLDSAMCEAFEELTR